MNKLINTRSLSASAFVAIATFTMMSLGGSTQASANVLSCKGKSFNSTVSCCEQMSRVQRASWMVEADQSCQKVVKCYNKRYCHVVLQIEDWNGTRGNITPTRQTRGK